MGYQCVHVFVCGMRYVSVCACLVCVCMFGV